MSEEVTIVSNDGNSVDLGILEETGRIYYHIRYIEGARAGSIEPSQKLSEVLKSEVEITPGFDYQVLVDFQDRTRELLLWRGTRQVYLNETRAKEMEAVEAKVTKAMRAWDRANAKPFVRTLTVELPEQNDSDDETTNETLSAAPLDDELEQELEESSAKAEAEASAEVEEETNTSYEECDSKYQTFECDFLAGHEEEHEYTFAGQTVTWSDEEASKPEQEPLSDFRKPVDEDEKVPF